MFGSSKNRDSRKNKADGGQDASVELAEEVARMRGKVLLSGKIDEVSEELKA